ncbi:unnamed protein product [Closterium sp. NIES-53]
MVLPCPTRAPRATTASCASCPPAPPVPPSPPAPPAPPNPPTLEPLANRLVLQLCQNLLATFNEWLEEPVRDTPQDEYTEAPTPAPRWGEPVDCAWDESAVGADDDVDAEGAEGDKGAEADDETGTQAGTEAGTKDDMFPEGAMGGDVDNGVEYWSRDGLPEKLPIPSYPQTNRERPHPS